MSEMIERAARALFTPYTAKDGIYSFFFKSYDAVLLAKDDDDGAALHLRHLDRAARAALSAALDPADAAELQSIALIAEHIRAQKRAERGGLDLWFDVDEARVWMLALKSSCASDRAQADEALGGGER